LKSSAYGDESRQYLKAVNPNLVLEFFQLELSVSVSAFSVLMILSGHGLRS